jgi:ATP synthase F1 delta subunit
MLQKIATKNQSKNYAKALLDLSSKEQNQQKIIEDLTLLANNFLQDSFRKISNPLVSRSQANITLETAVVNLPISDLVKKLLVLLNKKSQITLISTILADFTNLYNQQQNIIMANLKVAEIIDETKISLINSILANIYPNKQIKICQEVKKNITAGFILEIEGKTIDASLKSQLRILQNSLINNLN